MQARPFHRGRMDTRHYSSRSTEGAYPCGRSTGAESAPGESANLLPSY